MSYQNKTGTLSAGAHPGGCNGQDAYNDMLVTENLDGVVKTWETSKTSYMTSWAVEVANALVATDYKDAPIIVTKKNTSSGD